MDDYIGVADNDIIDFGATDNFFLSAIIKPFDLTRTTDYIINKEVGGVGYGFYLN